MEPSNKYKEIYSEWCDTLKKYPPTNTDWSLNKDGDPRKINSIMSNYEEQARRVHYSPLCISLYGYLKYKYSTLRLSEEKHVEENYSFVNSYFVRKEKFSTERSNLDPWGRKFPSHYDEGYSDDLIKASHSGYDIILYEQNYHETNSILGLSNQIGFTNQKNGFIIYITSVSGIKVYCVDKFSPKSYEF